MRRDDSSASTDALLMEAIVSTMSLIDLDQSDGLAKRFAYLATTYFNEPDEAKTQAAKIPLENLFRMLQMFRYDAFSDEPRSGILDLEGFGDQNRTARVEDQWHRKIRAAISSALGEVFAGVSQDEALTNVQSTLTWLATNKNPPPPDVQARTRAFFERFGAALS